MSKSFTVTAMNDSDNDDGESVILGFGTLPTGVVEGTLNATVNLVDDDFPMLTVSIEAAPDDVVEKFFGGGDGEPERSAGADGVDTLEGNWP